MRGPSGIIGEKNLRPRIFYIIKEEKRMGMTMSQKILAAHAGLDQVKAGQLLRLSWTWFWEMILHRRWQSTRWIR